MYKLSSIVSDIIKWSWGVYCADMLMAMFVNKEMESAFLVCKHFKL